MVQRFIWGNGQSKGIPLVTWDKVARPKKHGGLGLRSARMNNVVMLGKQLWGLVQHDEKFWVTTAMAPISGVPSLRRATCLKVVLMSGLEMGALLSGILAGHRWVVCVIE